MVNTRSYGPLPTSGPARQRIGHSAHLQTVRTNVGASTSDRRDKSRTDITNTPPGAGGFEIALNAWRMCVRQEMWNAVGHKPPLQQTTTGGTVKYPNVDTTLVCAASPRSSSS